MTVLRLGGVVNRYDSTGIDYDGRILENLSGAIHGNYGRAYDR
jgi:hypothetical protein